MARSKVPVYRAGAVEHLVSTPFAGLQGGSSQTAAAPVAESVAPAYGIARTRKGGWPLRIERRSGGKTVTVLAGVSGDGGALLRELKTLCGAGGTAREDEVEVQGDHCARIARWLDTHAPMKR